VTGGSPRYQIYRTADGGYLSAAPLEQRFWDVFCRLIGLGERFHDDSRDPAKVIEAVAACILARPTDHWRRVFANEDACCAVVASLAEAIEDPHFRAHNLFGRQTGAGPMRIPALPLPLADAFRDTVLTKLSPTLGADNHLIATEA
jgi:crotonobetainyl-CoA:carnitine CoA-transferase CaiB-like acyl-CoA transferase